MDGIEHSTRSTSRVARRRGRSPSGWLRPPRRMTELLREICGSGIVMQPSENDLASPELRPSLEQFMRGKDVDVEYKSRLFRFAHDLVMSSFGMRQDIYEYWHGGDPSRNRINLLRSYDQSTSPTASRSSAASRFRTGSSRNVARGEALHSPRAVKLPPRLMDRPARHQGRDSNRKLLLAGRGDHAGGLVHERARLPRASTATPVGLRQRHPASRRCPDHAPVTATARAACHRTAGRARLLSVFPQPTPWQRCVAHGREVAARASLGLSA